MNVVTSGPITDSRAVAESERMRAEAVEDVAQAAFDEVGDTLAVSLRNPTGYYESRVRVDRSKASAVVDDSDVIYGPWLEGVSDLNAASRFKGYAAFRKATQATQARVSQIVEPVVARHVARMNK